MIVVNRRTNKETEYQPSSFVKFLYNNVFGRMVLKLLTNKLFANLGAWFLNTKLSKSMADKKVKQYKIDMNKYINCNYKSYNEFFVRKLKKIDFNDHKNIFISPCDSKLMIFKLDDDSSFNIKGSLYKFNEIIDDNLINDYKGGYALIFRLDVNDYHHYIYVDDGYRSDYRFINGILHTVQPIVYDKVKVFHKNSREWCVLHTKHFDDIIEVEVGALLVGKIQNDKSITQFKKGQEKGFFEFGGSTIVLFVKDGVVSFDEDILKNSNLGKETIVCCGEKIGQKK